MIPAVKDTDIAQRPLRSRNKPTAYPQPWTCRTTWTADAYELLFCIDNNIDLCNQHRLIYINLRFKAFVETLVAQIRIAAHISPSPNDGSSSFLKGNTIFSLSFRLIADIISSNPFLHQK